MPDVEAAAKYYDEFGLTALGDGRFATVDGGEQLHLVATPTRRPLALGIGADDADDLGRVAAALLATDPGRHVWGLGRHHIGSNFFWYRKDPAGNFTELYADLDCIVDDELWTPGVFDAANALANWGPPVPPSFLAPDDLAELMAGAQR